MQLLFKRQLVGAAIFAFSLALVTGCVDAPDRPSLVPISETSPESVHGKLDVWSWNVAAESLKAIAPAYAASHPRVKVTVDMTGADMTMRFMLSLAAGTGAPDVSQLQLTDAPHYIATGRLADLTAVAARYRNSFPPALWDNCMSHGHVYAIPWDMGPCAIFYKRDLFARYGIDPTKIDTWDDYIAAGRKIVQASHGQTKMMPLAPVDLAGFFLMLLQETRGQVFDSNGSVDVDSPESQAALDVARKLVSSGICSNVPAYSQEWMAGISDDSIATYPGAVWMSGMIQDSYTAPNGREPDWGVFRLPAVCHGGLHVANSGGSVLVIPEQSTHKDAAWSFVEWALCSKQGQVAQYEDKNLFPSYLPAMQSEAVCAPQPFFDGERVGCVFSRDVDKIPRLNLTPQTAEAMDYMGQALSHWYATGMSDTNILGELESKLSQRLDIPESTRGPK